MDAKLMLPIGIRCCRWVERCNSHSRMGLDIFVVRSCCVEATWEQVQSWVMFRLLYKIFTKLKLFYISGLWLYFYGVWGQK